MPYAVSFDDNSYPVDRDFFSEVEPLFVRYPGAAILGASIWHRHEPQPARVEVVVPAAGYTGCGYAIRVAAYRQVRGTLALPVAYGMEETDLSIQFFASGWNIYDVGQLRVLHDTDLKHHASCAINAGSITNTGLFVFLHYPISHWGFGLLQVANRVVYLIRVKRYRGIFSGIAQIPVDCYRHRRFRRPLDWVTIKRFLDFRHTTERGDRFLPQL